MNKIETSGGDGEGWQPGGGAVDCHASLSMTHPHLIFARHDSAEAISVGSKTDKTNVLIDGREHCRYTVTNVP